ncbi:MAG: hypothetical protein II802_02765, partial [Clostridia bacterium]|nr:hypothetical protein [Clostridia bacterium]
FPQSTLESYEYCYGYKINYRVSSDISLLAGIIDLVDGIEIPIENEKLRYTGVQIADLVSTTVEKQVLKREITTALFDKISEVGLQKSDFVYIIENSETDLTVPQCYYWDEKIREMAQNTVILN